MSSLIGERSGNRGRCAQPCRMEYKLIKDDKTYANNYLLSPKDTSTLPIIDKLIKGQIYQDGIKVTVPEGSVSTEIVDLLVKKGLGQRKNFVNLFRHPENFVDKHAFLKNKRIVTLEGFLYPETYFFKKESSEKQIDGSTSSS